ncbi:MAG: sulfite exporter TauE/SafE family protein, partial [Pseudolabrys sp.]
GAVSGLAGFAFGLVVSGIWLHVVTPVEFAVLIVLSGLITQGYGIWKVRHSLEWRKVAPFVIGGAVGVPAGTALLAYSDPAALRIGIGVLLILYSLYNLTRPAVAPVRAGLPADLGIGVANGMLGGLTGLGGVIVTVWCQVRGGPKDAQRAIYQPVLFATFVMTTISLSFAGAVTMATMKLFLFSLPALIAGLWIGVRLYGKLDDAAFRKVVLTLLLVSGAILVIPY